jgi:phosphate acetyltransferase
LHSAHVGGIALGARPVLTSRAETVRSRMASCAVAVLYADVRRRMMDAPGHKPRTYIPQTQT